MFVHLCLVVLLHAVVQSNGQSCGRMLADFTTQGRIVGGEPADDYAWPWQVYITLGGSFICGGTLIDRQYVLTAAHCVIGQSSNPSDYLVRVGAHNMASSGYYTGTVYSVRSLYVHQNYVSAEGGYDIAIFRLYYDVQLSSTVNIVCLPPSSDFYIPNFQDLVITGFGLTSEGGRLPYVLQQAVIQQLPTCSQVYQRFYSSAQVCAGVSQGRVDTCQGDSGGPLVYQPRQSKTWYIVGITSYGIGCARAYYPGIYTRVSAYLDWINAVLAQR